MATLLLITLLSLSTIVLSLAENIVSIDCGRSESYVDSDNVTWIGDKGFVTTGESFEIPGNRGTAPPFSLRYFPSGKINCYINIPATKRQKTLVRTRFNYGNYDKKSSPPSFIVLYDKKHFESVVTVSQSISEVIFAPASEYISVCLIQTPDSDTPFISSIEVYSLDAAMYKDLGPNEGFFLQRRLAYGAKKIIGYPLDPYGRLWIPLRSNGSTMSELTTTAPSIDISGVSNKPPKIVMLKALSAAKIILSAEALPSKGTPFYLALYFSEPQSNLGRTQTRSFNIFLDTKQVGSGPIVPVFGKVTQVVLKGVVATSKSQVVVQSTDDSTLPPIINALELYLITRGVHGSVDGKKGDRDRVDLQAIIDAFEDDQHKFSWKKKLPLILGVSFASVLAVISSTVAAIFLRKRPDAESQSKTLPTTSTESGTLTGESPLIGHQVASDAYHAGHDEPSRLV